MSRIISLTKNRGNSLSAMLLSIILRIHAGLFDVQMNINFQMDNHDMGE